MPSKDSSPGNAPWRSSARVQCGEVHLQSSPSNISSMSALPIRSKSSGIDICPARNPSLHTLRPEPASGDLDRNSARLPPPPLPPLPDPAGAEPSRAAPARQPSAQYPATHRCGHQRHRRRPTQATGQDQTLRPTPAHCLIGLPPKNKGAFQSTTTPQPYGSSFDWERLLNC